MTIHGPGTPIYMSEIQAEFGGGAPYSLSNYYAGGALVPAGTTGAYGPIPSSGPISMQQFYGASHAIPPIFSTSMVIGSSSAFLYSGYSQFSFFCGSLSDNTFNPISNADILQLGQSDAAHTLNFAIRGWFADSGWGTMEVLSPAPITVARAGWAQNTNAGVQYTSWQWALAGRTPLSPYIGQTITINFYA